MIGVVTAAQARELDRRVIEGLGLPGVALMELASAAVARAVLARCGDRPVQVVCGAGNNGGDGWAAARWLHGWGVDVSVWAVDPPATADASTMATVARRMGVAEVQGPTGEGWVVDALFGTGLTRPVSGRHAEVVHALRGRPCVAVDLPTGLCADTGRALGVAWAACHTVTFGRPKLGMFAGRGPDLTGTVEVVDIGLGAATPPDGLVSAQLVEARDLRWPRRPPSAHKGRVGHLAVVAGSAAMAGAAMLCCEGALAGGVGLVTLVAPRGALPRLGGLPAEVMWVDGGAGDRLERLPALDRVTGWVVGPGLGGGQPLSADLATDLQALWRSDPRPVVFDADALPASGRSAPEAGPRALTPHAAEAGRLLGLAPTEVEQDRFRSVATLAERGVALLKGRHTLVCDGVTTINPTGNAVLATGGSGDVLSGLVGALLARGVGPGEAARTAAWVHGRAGDRLADRRRDGWTASDLARELPEAAEELASG